MSWFPSILQKWSMRICYVLLKLSLINSHSKALPSFSSPQWKNWFEVHQFSLTQNGSPVCFLTKNAPGFKKSCFSETLTLILWHERGRWWWCGIERKAYHSEKLEQSGDLNSPLNVSPDNFAPHVMSPENQQSSRHSWSRMVFPAVSLMEPHPREQSGGELQALQVGRHPD